MLLSDIIMPNSMNAAAIGAICAERRRREMSVGQAIGYLNTINCLSYGSSSALSEISKNCRSIFGLFGVDVPKEPISGVEVCDLRRLAISKD